ncbi:MAG TPA: DUF202 domain-containing protein [Bacteroidales bacterium]|nr:DUF202 domain-containing protein [Bacteroidales bacterium]HNS46183.1 DUF202 domain-containing protein [Bacteroidales bacterium]
MTNEKIVSRDEPAGKMPDSAKDRTDMAVDRTVMAADRSLMAWVRTGLSLISFGFTIYKFLQYQREQLQAEGIVVPDISGPKVFGLLLIGIGILSLLLGTMENVTIIKRLRRQYVISQPRYSLFISWTITIIGIILFAGIIFQLKGIS